DARRSSEARTFEQARWAARGRNEIQAISALERDGPIVTPIDATCQDGVAGNQRERRPSGDGDLPEVTARLERNPVPVGGERGRLRSLRSREHAILALADVTDHESLRSRESKPRTVRRYGEAQQLRVRAGHLEHERHDSAMLRRTATSPRPDAGG